MKLFNPFYIFALIFICTLISYSLGWSILYPNLTNELIVFLFVGIFISFILGVIFERVINKTKNIKWDITFSWPKNLIATIVFFIVLLLEERYSGGFPLLATESVYKDFGIPTIHVIFFIAVYFYTTRMFENYLETNNRLFFLFSLLNTIPFVLAVNRGLIALYFLNCFFLFLKIKKPKINIKYIFLLVVLGFGFLFFFGLFGNARMNKNYHYEANSLDSSLILKVGEASNKFEESSIPKTFFWTYLYTSSPLANLQTNINNYNNMSKEAKFNQFFITQLLPDVFSKRITEVNIQQSSRIRPELTVSTAFLDSFMLMGVAGMYIYLFFYFLFMCICIYLAQLYCREYFNFVISILCVLTVFQIFSNGLSYSVLSLQLILPFALSRIKTIKII